MTPAASNDTQASFAERLTQAVRINLGAEGVDALTPMTVGARKETWSFDAWIGGNRVPLIYQRALSSDAVDESDVWSELPALVDGGEFAVMRRAAVAGVPVPRIRCLLDKEQGLGAAAIMDRIDGETLGTRIVRHPGYAQARASLAEELGAAAAAIHSVQTELPEMLDHHPAERQLSIYRQVIEGLTEPSPALSLGLAWAERHVPQPPPKPRLVHGDFRLGNLIVAEDGLRAILDWEIAHTGDPLEDLGYLCMKSWRFGGSKPAAGVGEREALYDSYRRAGGGDVDPAAIRFWEVVGCIKWALSCLRRGNRALAGEEGALELVATGRRAGEPIYDLLTLIEETL